jgi:thiamine biosynthesis lipoprotein
MPSEPPAAEAPLIRYEASHDAMGTVFTIIAYGQDRDFIAAVVSDAFEEIDQLDAQMSNYKPESELSKINRAAGHLAVVVEPKLFQLIQNSLRYSGETGGAFDITVGPLMKFWGFFRRQGRVPPRSEIARLLKQTGYRHLCLDAEARTIRFDAPGVELDLGGIAKGHAVDQVVGLLRSNGITSALVSSGTSSIFALGAPPEERGWKVTIRDPRDAQKAADIIYLRNYSLSTSGSYEKFFKLGGKVYVHILNPHSGLPVENMLSAAVLAPEAMAGDALSTAFFVLGVGRSRKYLATHPNLEAVFYQPTRSKSLFRRTVLRSNSFSLPQESLAEIEKR